MIPEIGRRFGPYVIQDRLGGGGMGHVFLAWDARLHREVAVKLLYNECAIPGMRERFLREARAASALNHPNICTIFDIGAQDGDPYLVMELLHGENLKDRIEDRPIETDELLSIAREVAEALGAAHAKGVVHRDIKPANIFLVNKPNGGTQAKVLDFGLAKFESEVLGSPGARSLDITSAGSAVGTLAYMSPEQARGEDLDSRSDLFSFGVVLYEMATQRIPFPGATSALVFVNLLNHPPQPVRNWNENIPRELEKIILKLMSKERSARFQTARELGEALARVNEKGSGGGWLRKAASTVPLIRASDSATRGHRAPIRSASDSDKDRNVVDGSSTSIPEPPAHRSSGGENLVLRPVARLPSQGNSTPGQSDHAVQPAKASGASRSEPPPVRQLQKRSADSHAPMLRPSPFSRIEPPIEGVPLSASETDSKKGDFAAGVVPQLDPGRRKVHMSLSPIQLVGGAILLVFVGTTAAIIAKRGHFVPTLLAADDEVVLTEIENRTGNNSLDGTVTASLQIALSQSPYLRLRSEDSYLAARHHIAPHVDGNPGQAVARSAAERLGAKAYLFGSIKGSASAYLIHVDLFNTASDELMTSAEERVGSVQQIPSVIDRISEDIRSNIGEENDSITRTDNPLAREATTNLHALHAFSEGERAASSGNILGALGFYQRATALEPKFVQAQLKLAVLYRKQRAEVAAADTAKLALAAADNASERTRTLAEYEYEMNTSGDFARASEIIRHLLALYPHDAHALECLSRSLRLQGRMTEALQLAEQAHAEDPYSYDAYTQAENALIGLDRYDDAYRLEKQMEEFGLAHVGGLLTAAYLTGRPDAVNAAIAAFSTSRQGYRADWNLGVYLDNSGHLAQGASLWQSRADAAAQVKGLDSASAFLLSQGALDRALLGDCASGLTMAHESDDKSQGMNALFNSGMAHALCGSSARAQEIVDELQKSYPQSFSVNAFYVADIKAALALHDGDPAAAVDILRPARQYDLISLTAFLRGRAHVDLRQIQIGIIDFQTVLSHQGIAFIAGSDVYPVAEIGVARAFADTGDLSNSAEAYRRFIGLWRTADANQPLLAEARAHSH